MEYFIIKPYILFFLKVKKESFITFIFLLENNEQTIFGKYQVRKQSIQSYNLLLALLCICVFFFVTLRDRAESFNRFFTLKIGLYIYKCI